MKNINDLYEAIIEFQEMVKSDAHFLALRGSTGAAKLLRNELEEFQDIYEYALDHKNDGKEA